MMIERDRGYWDVISGEYDKFMFGEFGYIYDKLVEKIPKLIPKGALVLDVGTGTGIAAIAASPKAGRIIGIDMSMKMMEKAKKKIKERGIGNVEIQMGNLYSLPFENDSFDCALCCNTLHMVENLEQVFSEIKRVLKPKGLFISGTFCYGENCNNLKRMGHGILSFFWKIGLIPPIHLHKKGEFLKRIEGYFEIVEDENLSNDPLFLIVTAKK